MLLFIIERCQDTECLAVCRSCVATDLQWEGEHQTRPQSNGRRLPGFLLEQVDGRVHVRCLPGKRWQQDVLCEEGSPVRQRQCSALGNVLLKNLGSKNSYRCYLDTYHRHKLHSYGGPVVHNTSCNTMETSCNIIKLAHHNRNKLQHNENKSQHYRNKAK